MKTIADYHDLIICEWKKFFQVEKVEYIDLPQKENTISRSI